MLGERGYEVVTTREPGGTLPGRQIRALLLDADHELAAETELLLMCADRAEHVAKVIRPALARGAIVLSDRYAGSTRAYQGYGLGLDMALVDAAISIATGGIRPTLTVLFDVDPEVAFARRSGDSNSVNALDLRDLSFRKRVREGFLELARRSDCWRVIDASQTSSAVIDQASKIVNSAVDDLRSAK